MKVAIAQLSSTANKMNNLKKAERYVLKAINENVDIIIFPEFYMGLANSTTGKLPFQIAEPMNGPFVSKLTQLARSNKIHIICGIYESDDKETHRAFNTTVFINDKGEIIHFYRKTHLYDAFNNKESDSIIPGTNSISVIDTKFGKVGLMVCYELRFPEIARQLSIQGAEIIFVPSAWFSGSLKEDHWDILVRSRAIENTVFICGANQVGNVFIGRSMIVDPMGVSMARGGEEEGLIISTLNTNRVHNVRKKLPSLNNRKQEFYTLK